MQGKIGCFKYSSFNIKLLKLGLILVLNIPLAIIDKMCDNKNKVGIS